MFLSLSYKVHVFSPFLSYKVHVFVPFIQGQVFVPFIQGQVFVPFIQGQVFVPFIQGSCFCPFHTRFMFLSLSYKVHVFVPFIQGSCFCPLDVLVLGTCAQNNLYHSTFNGKKITNKHACDTITASLTLSPVSHNGTIQVDKYAHNNLYHSALSGKKTTNKHACDTMLPRLRYRDVVILSPVSSQWDDPGCFVRTE
jgi:hypothetical protein